MLYREIMAVCSEIHTKHINTLCGGTYNPTQYTQQHNTHKVADDTATRLYLERKQIRHTQVSLSIG